MSKLLRYFRSGDTCFITVVTYNRQSLLVANSDLLIRGIQRATSRTDTHVIAWVILPDHFHIILTPTLLSASDILHRIKLSFSRGMAIERRESVDGVWQRRFWDHIIRDQEDLNQHIDYVHYNPVKHGASSSPFGWTLSSARRYLREGYYGEDWGMQEPRFHAEDFGE